MRSHAVKLGELALDFLFPKWCVGCGTRGDFICADCTRHLARIHGPLCPQCGRPQTSDILCPACVNWPAAIDGIRAPFRFEGTIRQAVYDLKYHNVRTLAKPLSGLLHGYLAAQSIPADVLVPVPLHSKRLKDRGYNQSALLAGDLGKLTGLPVVNDRLIRAIYTSPQARTSSVGERLDNVAGAFACNSSAFRGLSVLLIDDVATSGATLNAAATALKSAGAITVWGLALAKEI
ncbi:MAG: ComF family protein [Dehalococcoidales bacterium]|nr:ComF family protein [Dehalococcoidales bacterium]